MILSSRLMSFSVCIQNCLQTQDFPGFMFPNWPGIIIKTENGGTQK